MLLVMVTINGSAMFLLDFLLSTLKYYEFYKKKSSGIQGLYYYLGIYFVNMPQNVVKNAITKQLKAQ